MSDAPVKAAAPADSPVVPTSRRVLIEAVIASTVGTTIEWYDFFLYGTAAALVFPRLFFPDADPFTGRLLSFGTFTAGFVARPLGGVIFGYVGDRAGRKAALVATLLLMGLSTIAIGLLPTYHAIGLAAPILLTVLRVIQGIGVGGEWGGAVLLALEFGHRGNRGFHASWPQAGVPLGLLTSTGVMALCQWLLSDDDFYAWGWRIPFGLSLLLILVGLFIRTRIPETPLFRQLREQNDIADAPVRETLRNHWRDLLLIAGTRMGENGCFYLFTAWTIAYGRDTLGLESGVMLRAVNVAAAVAFVLMPLYGLLSDRWSRRGAYTLGCIALLLFAWPFFALLDMRRPAAVMAAIVIGVGVIHSLLYGVQASLIPELFGTRLRCTGASIGYQLAAPLAGGLSPVIAELLQKGFPGSYLPLAGYVAVLAAISLVCVRALAERSRADLGAGSANSLGKPPEG